VLARAAFSVMFVASESCSQERHAPEKQETAMNEDVLNTTIRKFLKKVGVTSQREIEMAVREALAKGKLKGNEALPAKMKLTVGTVELAVEIDGMIELE